MLEFEALIAEHLEPARRKLERERVLYEQMQSVEIDVTSPDKTVKITQTCAGEVLEVHIAPGAFGKHDERSLAKILTAALQAARRAGAQAAEQATDEILGGKREVRYGR